ncbi:DNA repair protein RecO [Candidatus Giovannonibacteria bacterium]|nr:DNA repair protein RecO [Candidatus Giovannonibacteria bacterium]
MANGLYQTEGIILSYFDTGEADKVLNVFTKEFGMLKLFARGVRRHASKLNRYLNLFSYGRFGFVSGRNTWHLVDSEHLRYFDGVMSSEKKLMHLGEVSNFIGRFQKGEGEDAFLWSIIFSFFEALNERGDDEIKDLEQIFYAKALFVMGYLNEQSILELGPDEEKEKLSKIFHDSGFKEILLPLSGGLSSYLADVIKTGIAASHL